MGLERAGVATDGRVWALALLLAALWITSLKLIPSLRKSGWRAVPMCLFGFVWLGFGVDFVLRFVFLAYDSVGFGNFTYRLADCAAETVREALLFAIAFWACLCGGFACGRRVSGVGPYGYLETMAARGNNGDRVTLGLIALCCLVLAAGPFGLPLALVTPLALLGALWVVPAVLCWWDYFRGAEGRRRWAVRWLLLAPGCVLVVLSPYREHLVVLALVLLLAGLFAGKRYRLLTVALGTIVFLLASTIVIDAQRGWMWGKLRPDEAMARVSWTAWRTRPEAAPWMRLMRRFHALDSLLLTVEFVPRLFDYSGREVFLGSVLRGLVPRLIYPEKEKSDRGLKFSLSIWAVDNPHAVPAAVAPSMPGDLYEAGGGSYVVLGGFLWGFLVGVCEAWRRHVSPGAAAAVLALVGPACALSAEVDFAHAVATLIQVHVTLAVCTWLAARTTGVGAPRSRARVAVASGARGRVREAATARRQPLRM